MAVLAAAALVLTAAGCTSSGGEQAGPTTAVTQSGSTGSSAPSGTAGPSGSAAPTGPTPVDKPLSFKHITKKQGTKLESVIGGLPGVVSTAYYPDSHVFEVYFSKKASKLDHNVVTSLVKQNLAKK